MLNDTAKRWKCSGLLDELTDEQSNELANCLEATACYILSLPKEQNECFASTAIFPVVRLIYTGINTINIPETAINGADLFYGINKGWEEFKIENWKLLDDPKVDAEAEFLCQYCIDYVEDLKKRGII